MKIAVVSKDDKHLAEIAKLLRERNPSDDVFVVSGTLEKLTGISDLGSPNVLVLDQPSVEGGDLQRLERLGHLYPHLAFIILSPEQSPEFLIQAMRVGVREVLASPVSADTFLPAMARIEAKIGGPQVQGKVLAFISCKGGSGATFIATNLGYALAALENTRVALIDLNLQFGDASLYVSDKKPLATLRDVAQQIHRLDPSFLASSMINVAPTFSVLAAPEDPAHANDVKPEHVEEIIRLARRHYDFVLLDVGHNLDAVSIRALDQADMIFPILQSTLPYIRDGKRLLGVFRSLDYRKDKIHLIVNRYEKDSEIGLQDMKNAYGTGIFRTIPNHYQTAAASVNQGVPILKLAKNSPISKALQEFAQSLAGDAGESSLGWFSRVLKRA